MGNFCSEKQIFLNENQDKENDRKYRQQKEKYERDIQKKVRSEVTKTERENLASSHNLKKFFQSSTWCLDFSDISLNIPYLLSLLGQCHNVHTLKIASLITENTLYIHLMNPKFCDLKKLIVSKNFLQSTEFLVYINAPNLEQLYLNENHLVSVRGLRKLQSKLKILNLSKNSFSCIADNLVSQIDFDPRVECLHIEDSQRSYFGDDINWLFKLKPTNIFRLSIGGSDRIKISVSKNFMMKERFKSIDGIIFWGPQVNRLLK